MNRKRIARTKRRGIRYGLNHVITNHSQRLRRQEDAVNYLDMVMGKMIESMEAIEEKLGIIKPLPPKPFRRPR